MKDEQEKGGEFTVKVDGNWSSFNNIAIYPSVFWTFFRDCIYIPEDPCT
jgi:hypothetical protein